MIGIKAQNCKGIKCINNTFTNVDIGYELDNVDGFSSNGDKMNNVQIPFDLNNSNDISISNLRILNKLSYADRKRVVDALQEAKTKKLNKTDLQNFLFNKLSFLAKDVVKSVIQIAVSKGIEFLITNIAKV
jgi:hypothetical protein